MFLVFCQISLALKGHKEARLGKNVAELFLILHIGINNTETKSGYHLCLIL